MLYAPKPKSREITECSLKDGALYLYSEAGTHRIIPMSRDIARLSFTCRDSFSNETKPGVILNGAFDGWNLNETDKEISFYSDELMITIDKKTGSYRYYDGSGKLLLAEKSSESRTLEEFTAYRTGEKVTKTVKTADGEKTVVTDGVKIETGRFYHTRLHLEFADDEALYGLGQHEEGFMNLRGKTVYVYQANRKIAVPMLVSSKGYGILTDTYSPMIFNNNEYGSYIYTEADAEMDYYFINGKTPDGVVAGYRRLTGKASLLPKWAFGYWQSQERYESFDEIINTVKEFRRRNIGLDCIVQDWCSWPGGQWGQKSFDSACYPAPSENISKIHELGAKFMLSIWPNPSAGTDDFVEFDKSGLMLETKDCYNAFSPAARKMYWEQVKRSLYCHGVDAWWCDSCEPVTSEWNLVIRHEPGRAYEDYIRDASERFDYDKMNAYPFWHSVTLYEGQRGCTNEKRVVNLTRCAYTGQQRYSCVLWSGDTDASWETYRRQIAAGLNFSASGLPYWTMDIGAFFVKKSVNWYWKGNYDSTVADPAYRELYVRWYQWGSYLPVFRAHGTDCRREPWAFEDESDMRFYDALVKANRNRYTLLPYIYSAAAAAYLKDKSIIKPLGFEYPEDEIARNIKTQYMFGDSMMVCPVTKPMYFDEGRQLDGDTKISVYLPEGGWYSMSTNEYYRGGQYVSVDAPIDEIPVFVREGSIIPCTEFKPNTDEQGDIRFKVYAGKDAGYTLYEDAGDGYGYESGEYTLTRITWSQDKGVLSSSDGRIFDAEIISH